MSDAPHVNLFFLRLTRAQLERLGGDLPEDFLLPVASLKPFEQTLRELSQRDIYSGLVLAWVDNPNHEHRKHWLWLLQQSYEDSLPVIWRVLLACLSTPERFATSRELVEDLHRRFPEDSRTCLLVAEVHRLEGERHARDEEWHGALEHKRQARDLYQKAMDLPPSLPEAYKRAGWFFLSAGDEERCLELWQKYLEQEPSDSTVQQAVMELLSLREEDQLFKAAYDKVMLGQEEEGLALTEQLLKRRQNVWHVWFLHGWALRRLGRYEEALQSFETALELNPDHVDTLNERALCLLELGYVHQAQDTWQRALELEPLNVKILSNLGIAYLKAGKNEDAAAYFRSVLDIDPNDPVALRMLQRLEGTD